MGKDVVVEPARMFQCESLTDYVYGGKIMELIILLFSFIRIIDLDPVEQRHSTHIHPSPSTSVDTTPHARLALPDLSPSDVYPEPAQDVPVHRLYPQARRGSSISSSGSGSGTERRERIPGSEDHPRLPDRSTPLDRSEPDPASTPTPDPSPFTAFPPPLPSIHWQWQWRRRQAAKRPRSETIGQGTYPLGKSRCR